MVSFDFRAQGTIEYLVIIAVVVVISLVVVGLMVGQTGNVASISSNSKQVALKVGGIAILDSVAGEDANALLVLQNNSGDSLTLQKVVVDGVDHVFGSEHAIGLGEKISLDLNGIVPCTISSSKKNYSVKIVYTSSSGLEKTFDFGSVSLDCVPSVTANGAVVSEGGDTNSGENQTPVNGVCGGAAKNYFEGPAFPDGNYCSSGSVNIVPIDGPSEGIPVNWLCLGINGGNNSSTCIARMELEQSFIIAPSDLSATHINSSELDLNWIDNSNNETGFRIERSLNDSDWFELANVGENVTSYVEYELGVGSGYYYRVLAYNDSSTSDYSNEVLNDYFLDNV